MNFGYFCVGFVSGIAGAYITKEHGLTQVQGTMISIGLSFVGAIIYTLIINR